MSPENIRTKTFSEKSDVWSYGVLLFELITGAEPYKGEDLIEIAVSIRDHARNPLPSLPEGAKAPKYLVKVMKGCFEVSPQDRPTFKQIVAMLTEKRPEGYESAQEEQTAEPLLGLSTRKRKSSKQDAHQVVNADSEESVEMESRQMSSIQYAPINDGTTPKSSGEKADKTEESEKSEEEP